MQKKQDSFGKDEKDPLPQDQNKDFWLESLIDLQKVEKKNKEFIFSIPQTHQINTQKMIVLEEEKEKKKSYKLSLPSTIQNHKRNRI